MGHAGSDPDMGHVHLLPYVQTKPAACQMGLKLACTRTTGHARLWQPCQGR